MNTYHSKISVVIPLYNKEKHVIRTIDSVLSQHLPAEEIIVVNDGSSDNSVEIIKEERGQYVRIINQPNQGVSVARNTGIKASKFDFVAFIDADDTWDPHFLQEIDTLILNHPSANCFATNYQIVIGDNQYIDPKIRWVSKPNKSEILANFFELGAKGELPFQMSSFCVKKKALDTIGYFPENEPMGEDQEFFIKAAITGDIAYSPRILSFYFKNAENRACNRNTPSEECAFSRRLHAWALNHESHKDLSRLMIDYTGAHILHLVSENVKSNKFDTAKRLLADYRCKRHLKRYLWWKLNIFFRKSLSTSNQNMSI